MLQDMIAKEDVLAAAEQLKELLPYNEDNVQLMKKALILYRQDSVYRIQVQTPTEISAYVQDVVPVRVTLNLFFMVKSGCACPSEAICRHVLAVFLYVYAQFERVGTFTEHWLEREKLEESRELVRRQFQEKVLPNEESLSSWLAFLIRNSRCGRRGRRPEARRCRAFITAICQRSKNTPRKNPSLKAYIRFIRRLPSGFTCSL